MQNNSFQHFCCERSSYLNSIIKSIRSIKHDQLEKQE